MWILFVVVAAVIGVVVGLLLRPNTVPKPFGLEAFEAQGLDSASQDVIKATFAVIRFLEHPVTVIEDAVRTKAVANSRAVNALDQAEDSREDIRELEAKIVGLESLAKASTARAGELDALVVRVNTAVGQ